MSETERDRQRDRGKRGGRYGVRKEGEMVDTERETKRWGERGGRDE